MSGTRAERLEKQDCVEVGAEDGGPLWLLWM